MGTNNLVFLENLEWFDNTGQELVHRLPEEGSAEIKYGAQLTVRESQAGVFFYKGKAVGAFGAGRHTLKTANIPILTKIASLPWAGTSPLRAEMYFINLKVFILFPAFFKSQPPTRCDSVLQSRPKRESGSHSLGTMLDVIKRIDAGE